MFSGGYQGKYLRINLTNKTIEEKKLILNGRESF
jgi:hypothetical protein